MFSIHAIRRLLSGGLPLVLTNACEEPPAQNRNSPATPVSAASATAPTTSAKTAAPPPGPIVAGPASAGPELLPSAARPGLGELPTGGAAAGLAGMGQGVGLSGVDETGKRVTLDVAGRKWEVLNGTWQVEGSTLVGSGGTIRSVDQFADGKLHVVIETPQPLGERTIGVAFRTSLQGSDPRVGNGYGCNYTSLQTFNVFVGKAGSWQPVKPEWKAFQSLPALSPTRNTIDVQLKGPRMSCRANGQELLSFEDNTWPRGHFSFWVESSAHQVRFSNIELG